MGVLNTGGRTTHRYTFIHRLWHTLKSIPANIRGEGLELAEAIDSLRSRFRVSHDTRNNPPAATWDQTTDTQIVILAEALAVSGIQNRERLTDLETMEGEVNKISLYIRDTYPRDIQSGANVGRPLSGVLIAYMSGRKDGER